MHNAVKNNGKVLVHCNAGVSRSSTFVIAYIMKFESLDFDSAFNKVRSVRPSIRPNVSFYEFTENYVIF
jgi:protein-tyrosine phosphatase